MLTKLLVIEMAGGSVTVLFLLLVILTNRESREVWRCTAKISKIQALAHDSADDQEIKPQRVIAWKFSHKCFQIEEMPLPKCTAPYCLRFTPLTQIC